MTGTPRLTDRKTLDLHRVRAGRQPALFLHEEAATEIEERLAEINKSFTAPALVGHITPPLSARLPSAKQVTDSERLSLEHSAHDLILHVFGLHWADDPVGQLVQARLALKPDGLLMAAFFGGTTLHELRAALAEAEIALTGGLSPRVLPMADLRDLGDLLQRAGLALPVADSRKLTVRYPDLVSLVRDLRGMGETNALQTRHKALAPRALFSRAEEIYKEKFSSDGYLTATFEIVFLTGWAPDKSQPQPMRPGSAASRLADALGTTELSLQDTAKPDGSR